MYIYILKSEKDGSLYVGSTKELNERIESHNKGFSLATRAKRPWVLAKVEEYASKSLALKRERFLKTGKGREILKNLIK